MVTLRNIVKPQTYRFFWKSLDRRYAAWYSAGGRLIDKFPELQAGFHQLWRHIEAAAGEEARGGAVRQLQAWEAGKP